MLETADNTASRVLSRPRRFRPGLRGAPSQAQGRASAKRRLNRCLRESFDGHTSVDLGYLGLGIVPDVLSPHIEHESSSEDDDDDDDDNQKGKEEVKAIEGKGDETASHGSDSSQEEREEILAWEKEQRALALAERL